MLNAPWVVNVDNLMTWENNLSFNIPEIDLTKDLLLPTPPRKWHRRTGGQLKTWATTIKTDLKPLSGP